MLKSASQFLRHTAFQPVICCCHDLRYRATKSVVTLKCKKRIWCILIRMHQIRFSPGLRPDPARGAHDAPPNLLVGWEEGCPVPIPHFFDAFGASFSAPTAPYLELGETCSKDLGGLGWQCVDTNFVKWKMSLPHIILSS